MSYSTSLIGPSVLAISVLTTGGILLHDMEIDRAAMTAFSLPVSVNYTPVDTLLSQLDNSQHTHMERDSLARSAHELMNMASPQMMPRDDHRKYVLAKRVVRGVHSFDGYHLPDDV